MADTQALIKELETVRTKYQTIFAECVKNKVPGFIDMVGLTCQCGESCGTGTSKVDPRLGMEIYQTDKTQRLLNP